MVYGPSPNLRQCQVGYMRQKTHGSTNATKYINAANYSLSRENLKNDSLWLLHASLQPNALRSTNNYSTYLLRRYLFFTADSQLVTPQAARGAAVALISVSSRSVASRLYIFSLLLELESWNFTHTLPGLNAVFRWKKMFPLGASNPWS